MYYQFGSACHGLEGHSCKIGNAQTLAGIKAKSMLEVF